MSAWDNQAGLQDRSWDSWLYQDYGKQFKDRNSGTQRSKLSQRIKTNCFTEGRGTPRRQESQGPAFYSATDSTRCPQGMNQTSMPLLLKLYQRAVTYTTRAAHGNFPQCARPSGILPLNAEQKLRASVLGHLQGPSLSTDP